MADSRKLAGYAALYDDPNALVSAAAKVRDAGWKKWDCHSPYPVHGLDQAMGLKPSPIPYICLGGGFVGAALAMWTQWWMSAVDYPVRIGGKPLFSWPAFTPVAFELFVLFAALGTFAAMLVLCRLGRWYSPLYDAGVMAEVTSTRFAVVLGADDELFTEDGARRLLEETGSADVRPLHDEGPEGEEALA